MSLDGVIAGPALVAYERARYARGHASRSPAPRSTPRPSPRRLVLLARRRPGAQLAPYVTLLWASSAGPQASTARRPVGGGPLGHGGSAHAPLEQVLPTGLAHVVLRLAGPPLRLVSTDLITETTICGGVVGGPRAAPYAKRHAPGSETVGAQLRPGATAALLGASGRVLADVHTPLAEVLGPVADAWCEQLLALPDANARLARFEALLIQQLREPPALHPAVAHALAHFARAGIDPLTDTTSVRALARETGYSHRHLTALFEEAIGLTPKRWARMQRFRRALTACQQGSESLSALALRCGYADQAHLTREFREFSGTTPARYRGQRPEHAYHLLVKPPR